MSKSQSNQVARKSTAQLRAQNGDRATLTKVEMRSGPLPDPQDLAAYDTIHPGLADRIVKMVENQAAHRQALERNVITADISQARLGLIFGLIIGMAGLTAGVTCILYGHEITGALLGGSTLASLVGTFVYGSIARKREREQKAAPKPMAVNNQQNTNANK